MSARDAMMSLSAWCLALGTAILFLLDLSTEYHEHAFVPSTWTGKRKHRGMIGTILLILRIEQQYSDPWYTDLFHPIPSRGIRLTPFLQP